MLRLAVPGVVGALIGTAVLVLVDGDALRPVLAVVLLVLGLRILLRFSLPLPMGSCRTRPSPSGCRR